MKPKVKTLLLLILLAISGISPGKACNYSDLTVDSVTVSPFGTYLLHMTFCVGGGFSVSTMTYGAGDATGRFSFAFYTQDTNFHLLGYTPQFVSDTLHSVYQGTAIGPNPLMGSYQTVEYRHPSRDYACLAPTSLCGEAHQDCKRVMFEVTEAPDSIRLWGLEAGGIYTAGCHDPDLVVNFLGVPRPNLPLNAVSDENGIRLDWPQTGREVAGYEVFRSEDGRFFQPIVTINGNEAQNGTYSWLDENMTTGTYYYRVVPFTNASVGASKIVEAHFVKSPQMHIQAVFPKPAGEEINLLVEQEFPGEISLSLVDIMGKAVLQTRRQVDAGVTTLNWKLGDVPAGTYFLRTTNGFVTKTEIVTVGFR